MRPEAPDWERGYVRAKECSFSLHCGHCWHWTCPGHFVRVKQTVGPWKMGFGETRCSFSQMFISSQPQAHGMASEPSGEECYAEVEGTVLIRTLCDIQVQRTCEHRVGKRAYLPSGLGPGVVATLGNSGGLALGVLRV